MIKLEKFALSKRPYAVDLDSLKVVARSTDYRNQGLYRVSLHAVWFRGPKTAPKACIGRLWDYMSGNAPTTAVEAPCVQFEPIRGGASCAHSRRW